MSFGLLSAASVIAGVAALALGLWLAQRLRVRHREVEVLSTIFWQQALQETRARIFVRRFRHWWAWVLLVAITALLWMLLAQPQTFSLDGTRHIVLIDWSVDDAEVRRGDLGIAIDFAQQLPTGDREIIAVSSVLETLLQPNEPLDLARARFPDQIVTSPADVNWAIEALAARATEQSPLSIHIVGSIPVDQHRVQQVRSALPGDGNRILKVTRIDRQAEQPRTVLATLGLADSATGPWDTVDVWIAPHADGGQPVEATPDIRVSEDGEPVTRAITSRGDGVFELRGVPARGSTLDVAIVDQGQSYSVGSIKLPNRTRIRVLLEPNVPDALRELIELDPACQIVVTDDADVRVGASDSAQFRLTGDDDPAFRIDVRQQSAEDALEDLVSRLALEQIDATGIAEASGRVIEVQVADAPSRRIAVWDRLFSPAFDFQESRACPVFVSRSIRWLSGRPPLVPWVERGERLPIGSPEFGRAIGAETTAADGRVFPVTRLAASIGKPAEVAQSERGSWLWRFHPMSWLGLIVAAMLVSEWVLYQRGHIP